MEKDTFAHGNTTYHINEYYGSLYGRNAISSSKTKIEFLQSDGITSLIPVAVFSDLLQTSSGVFTHMGKEWGVIIDFFSDSQEIRHYIVQVIDINKSDNVDGNNPSNPLNQSGRYLVEVRPLFEVEFIWLTSNSGKVVANLDYYVGLASKYYGEYTSVRDYTRTGSGYLYAMPEYLYYYYVYNFSYYHFPNAKRNYIKNISFSGKLANEQEANLSHGNTYYIPNQDFGMYFCGNDFHFTAYKINDLNQIQKRDLENTITTIRAIAGFIPWNPLSYALSMWDVLELAGSSPLETYNNQDSPYFKYAYPDWETQFKQYGHLMKDSRVEFTETDKPNLALAVGQKEQCYARAVFYTLQRSDDQHRIWVSRMETGFRFDVHRYGNNTLAQGGVKGVQSQILRGELENYKEVTTGETTVYNYFQNTSRFRFTAPAAGWYRFDFENPAHKNRYKSLNTNVYLNEGQPYNFTLEYLFNDIGTSKLTIEKVDFNYTLINNGAAWSVSGLADIAEIAVPSQYRNLPVTEITENAFRGFNNIETVSIPASVTSIGVGAFSNCQNLTTFTVDSANTKYISIGGILYTKNAGTGGIGSTLIAYPAGKTETSFAIPANIFDIASYAFSGCTNLEKVVFKPSSSIVYCGVNPFDQNSNLEIIVDGDLLEEYQTNIFWAAYRDNFEVPQSLIKFTTNGGGNFPDTTVYYGQSFYLPVSQKTGYTFAGWYDNDGYCYYIYTLWNSLNETVILNAAWVNKTYTVVLDDTEVTYEILYTTYNVALPGAKIPVKQACDYIGYNIDIGEEIPYYFESDSNAELWDLNGTVLYEDWQLTIEFFSEGGVIEVKQAKPGTFIYEVAFTPPLRAGFKFASWYTEPNGNGTEFSEFTAYFNVKFYAKWECTINFSITNGEDLILNYTNAPANAIFAYMIGAKEYSVNIFGTSGTHSLLYNLGDSGNYSSPKNVTIVLKNIKESGSEAIYSLNNQSLTFCNMFSGGTGTASDPYTINYVRHLKNIGKSSDQNLNYKLLKELFLTGNWTPIDKFSGTLDGGKYPIYNLTISIPDTTYSGYCGLISINNGTIKNLALVYPIIDINTTGNPGGASSVSVGAIAGRNNGVIQDCNVTGTRNDNSSHIFFYNYNVDSYAGGIVGRNLGLIKNCNNYYLTLLGYGNLGGVAGHNTGLITGSTNCGHICLKHYWQPSFTAKDNKSAGGIVGAHFQGYGSYGSGITNCTADGSVAYSGGGAESNLKPHMGQIIGYRVSGSYSGNTGNSCTVNAPNLTESQKQYIGNRAIGRDS